jgi:hypothetical protein
MKHSDRDPKPLADGRLGFQSTGKITILRDRSSVRSLTDEPNG